MPPGRQLLTYADYLSWEDDRRWELIAGEAYAMSSPSSLHQLVSMGLTARLLQGLAGSGCQLLAAPMDVKLSEHDVVQPDLLVVCDPKQIRATHIEGAPRLVIEIVSPSTQRHDRMRKLSRPSRRFARRGRPTREAISRLRTAGATRVSSAAARP